MVLVAPPDPDLPFVSCLEHVIPAGLFNAVAGPAALIPHDHTVPAARRAADPAEHARHEDVGERLTDLDAHGDETTGLTNGEMVGTPGQPRGAPRIVRPTEAVVREALVEHH